MERKERRWEKRKIISYIRRPRCNGGYFALQNTRSTPVPTSPPALSPLVIPATPPENNIYLLPARGKRTRAGNELRKERQRQSSLIYPRCVIQEETQFPEGSNAGNRDHFACLMIINTVDIDIMLDSILAYAYDYNSFIVEMVNVRFAEIRFDSP